MAHYRPGNETLQYFEQYQLFGDPTLEFAAPLGASLTDQAYAVRDFSKDHVASGETITVSLQVEVADPPPSAIIVKEKLPTGWTVSNATWNGSPMAPTLSSGEYKWLFGVGTPVADGVLQYQTVPTGSPGAAFVFSGAVLFGTESIATTGELLVTISLADRDEDGMPDDWEDDYGLNPDDPADAAEDWDGDGRDNLGEYLSDTHPLDAGSILAITGFSVEDGTAIVEWKGGTNATQYLERTENLADPGGWSVIGIYPAPTPVTNSFSDDTASGVPRRFYRLRATR